MHFAFPHWLPRQVGFEALLQTRRAALNRAVAEAIEEGAAPALSREDDDSLALRTLARREAPAPLAAACARLAAHFAAGGAARRSAVYVGLEAIEHHAAGRVGLAAEAARRALDGAVALVVRAALQNVLGHSLERLGDFSAAEVAFREAARLADLGTERDSLRARLRAEGGLGSVLIRIGRFDEAERLLAGTVAAARERGDAVEISAAENRLGGVFFRRGDYPAALRHFEAALAFAEAADDARGRATSLGNVGNVHWMRVQLDDAERKFRTAQEMFQAIGDLHSAAGSLSNLGLVAQTRGRQDEGAELHARALSLRQAIGDREGEASSLQNLGNALAAQGQFDEAKHLLVTAIRRLDEIGSRPGAALARVSLGQTHLDAGEPEAALSQLSAACDRAAQIGDRRTHAIATAESGRALCALGRHDEARVRLSEGDALAADVGILDTRVRSLAARSKCRLHSGDPTGALADAEQAVRVARELGIEPLVRHAETALAAVPIPANRGH